MHPSGQSHNTLGPWMHAGDAAEAEDVPYFSEEEETMSQTGRPMTDQELEEMGLSPPKDDMDDDDVEDLEEINDVEESEEEEGGDGTAEQYFQKYGVMKPPPCPKQMPQMGSRMRPPEPAGPPPGHKAPVKPAKAEPKPADVGPAAAVPPQPAPPPPAGVTTVQWTKAVCTKTTAVLPPPPPPAVEAHSSTSSSSRPSEAVVPYEEEYDDEYELGGGPDPNSTTGTAMVKWKQQLGSYIGTCHGSDVKHDIMHCVTNDVIDTCQPVRQ